MFADDIVLCGNTRNEAQQELERWRDALEKRGMKVGRSKTEYFVINGDKEEKVLWQG